MESTDHKPTAIETNTEWAVQQDRQGEGGRSNVVCRKGFHQLYVSLCKNHIVYMNIRPVCQFTCALLPSNESDQYRGMTLPEEKKSSRLHSSSFHEQMSGQSGKNQPGTRS